MRHMHSCSVVVVIGLACCSVLHAGLLYDGSLNSAPDAQGWFQQSDTPASVTVDGGATTVATTEINRSGYHSMLHPGVGVLDSSAGFTLRFSVQLLAEDHFLNNDRAGFSITMLDSTAHGVELGFWSGAPGAPETGEIWAQSNSPLFTHSLTEKKTGFDVTSEIKSYELSFLASGYTLSSGGTTLFSGSLKDYSEYLSGPSDPYEIPNSISFGDNTTSASATVSIFRIELVPEPATMSLLAFSALALLRRRSA